MLIGDAPMLSLNMPSEKYDHQKVLKEERARDMKSFLDKQARENPRLRRLRASEAPIQTSITHPNQRLSDNNITADFIPEQSRNRNEERKDSRLVESERHSDNLKYVGNQSNRSYLQSTERGYDNSGPGLPPEDGYRYHGGSWGGYNPPPPMWYPPMPQNNYYPVFGGYPSYPDRNYQRDNYSRPFDPMPPNNYRDQESHHGSQYPPNPPQSNRNDRHYNREFTESEAISPDVAKSKAQGYAAELRK